MKNFRQKKFTTRITPITQKQIERLRATRLKNAKSSAQTRFFRSKQFDAQLKRNIKANRRSRNVRALNKIADSLATNAKERKVLNSLFGESTRFNAVTGQRRKVNSLTSVKQTKRLDKIVQQIENKSFKFERRIQQNKRFKAVKQFLPKNKTVSDLIAALDRTEFYYENKSKINEYNAIASKKGTLHASNTAVGIHLRNQYTKSLDKDVQNLLKKF